MCSAWRLIVHSSSESIGTIAAALAKAQAELTNPEKSLIATVRSAFPRERDRTFRYAPLSSGLDIVRKSLGRHEIATVQTTEIDKDAGLVRLTTVLAHSSGQWISSEWPVCPISDTSSPQRMGAALTYARRYALFTLVGIAGEDDLDAPSSDVGTKSETTVPGKRNGHSDSATRSPSILPGSGPKHDGKCLPSAGRPILESIASAKLRDQLTAELQVLSSADEATAWARRSLPSKNTLTAADARMVEAAFQLKISALTDEQSEPPEAGHNQAVSAPTLAIGIPAEEMHEPGPSAPSDGAHA